MKMKASSHISSVFLSAIILLSGLLPGCQANFTKKTDINITPIVTELETQTESQIKPVEVYDKQTVAKDLQVAYSDFAQKSMMRLGNDLTNDSNLLYSPLSLHMSLSLLEKGAAGLTKAKLQEALWGNQGFTDDKLDAFYQAMDDGILEVANSLWLSDDFELKEQYTKSIQTSYQAEIFSRDFSDGAAVEADIVAWVKEKTHGLLGDRFTLKVSPDNRLYLLNALYLKNAWNKAFEASENTNESFTQASGKTQTVTMMNQFNDNAVLQTADYAIASLDLQNGAYVRFALPSEKTTLKELSLRDDFYQNLLGDWYANGPNNDVISNPHVSWKLPKTNEFIELDLKDALKALDLDIMSSNMADFSEIAEIDDEILQLASAMQQVRVKMDEEGVEAAAVTMMTMASAAPMASAPVRINMHLNRPYAYAIFNAQGVAVFSGLMNGISD